MPKINVFNTKGSKTGTMTLPEEIFAAPVKAPLVAQAVRTYLANQRKARAKTKKRGEVRGSTRKIYRQKGTGRARHADRYAPIFVGGGIAHGPRGVENWHKKMPKKMRRLALFSALTDKLKEGEIMVVEGLEKVKPKTKEMAKIIKNLKLKIKNNKPQEKIMLILPEPLTNVIRSARNLDKTTTIQAQQLNTYQVLSGGQLVFLKPSINVLKETFLKKKA